MTAETLPILYQDNDLVIIDKPSGLLVHRSEIDRHETRFAMQLLRDQLGQYVYPVHRLDKPTSGLLCFALHKSMAQQLTAQWSQASKRYLAVVRGVIDEQGTYDKPLQEPWDKYGDRGVNPDKEAQQAVTHFRRLGQCELPVAVDRYPTSHYSFAEFTLEQGRRHQIRRHCKSFSHPVIGDTTYGKARHNQVFTELFGNHRLLLHAYRIELQHPITGDRLVVKAPVTGEFSQVLEKLQWDSLIPGQEHAVAG